MYSTVRDTLVELGDEAGADKGGCRGGGGGLSLHDADGERGAVAG